MREDNRRRHGPANVAAGGYPLDPRHPQSGRLPLPDRPQSRLPVALPDAQAPGPEEHRPDIGPEGRDLPHDHRDELAAHGPEVPGSTERHAAGGAAASSGDVRLRGTVVVPRD